MNLYTFILFWTITIIDLATKVGLVRDLNPGPLAPKARIIPLDQRADVIGVLVAVNKQNYIAKLTQQT